MTLTMAMIFVGMVLMYAGIQGYSFLHGLRGELVSV